MPPPTPDIWVGLTRKKTNDQHGSGGAPGEIAWANTPQCRMQLNQEPPQNRTSDENEQPPDEQNEPPHTNRNENGLPNQGIAGIRPEPLLRANAPQCRAAEEQVENQNGHEEAINAKRHDNARVEGQNDLETDDEGTPGNTNRADAIIYADDTNLLVEGDDNDELERRLCNYQLCANKRDLDIQWAKAKIVASKKKTEFKK
eukprot:GEMP01093019.1.p1 GENE.GEMP01093019.1~~GEMP01093019.1.p1  ORF type:complete len:201 (+),score=38.78 GEMP01093019.1:176-778(+)